MGGDSEKGFGLKRVFCARCFKQIWKVGKEGRLRE
jgi:hypothetical protein